MRVMYIGDSKSIVKNLLELGVTEVIGWGELKWPIDGILVTKDLLPVEMSRLKELKVPIILSSSKLENQRDLDVLVLDKDEMDVFCGTTDWKFNECRERIKELKIRYLVVSLGKEEIKKGIEQYYCLPQLIVEEVQITDKDVKRAKDVITAIVGYIYIKEGKLSPQSIQKSRMGAVLEVVKAEQDRGCWLKIKLKH